MDDYKRKYEILARQHESLEEKYQLTLSKKKEKEDALFEEKRASRLKDSEIRTLNEKLTDVNREVQDERHLANDLKRELDNNTVKYLFYGAVFSFGFDLVKQVIELMFT